MLQLKKLHPEVFSGPLPQLNGRRFERFEREDVPAMPEIARDEKSRIIHEM